MTIGSEKDLAGIQKAGKAVALALKEMIAALKPGMTTKALDEIGRQALVRHGATSAPKLVYNFPGTTCISVNDEAAHGIPGNRVIKEGDLVNIDVSAEVEGYFADNGSTVMVGNVGSKAKKLCQCSKRALEKAISIAKAGTKINEIGKIIEQEAKSCGFTVIRNLAGHGVGRSIHEEPHNILNFYRPLDNARLEEGQVLAIETFVADGANYVYEESDGWTLKTQNRKLVAQYEHTIIVGKGDPLIVTAL